VQQLENSLRGCGPTTVDLYWLHNFDPATPARRPSGRLDDLISAGKIRYVGFSDVAGLGDRRGGHHRAVPRLGSDHRAVKLEYSLLERTAEGELIPMARALGLAVMPWGPLKKRVLVGQVLQRRPPARSTPTRTHTRRRPERGRLRRDRRPQTPWPARSARVPPRSPWPGVQGRPGITSTLVGARRMDQFEDNLRAQDVTLTGAQRGAAG